jgi:shikimate kinase
MHALAAGRPAAALSGRRPASAPAAARPSLRTLPRPALSARARQQQQQPQRWPLFPAAAAAAEGSAEPAKNAAENAAAENAAPEQGRPFTVDEDFDLLSNEVKKLTDLLSTELCGCSLYLVGMMGSGKTTVGRMLANTLRYAFFDTDSVIEAAHGGKSVSDIFRENGEEYFRRCESQVLQELAPYKSLVVATGGGAVANPKNWSYMHAGIVAWLQGEPTLLARRVVADGAQKRPLLSSSAASSSEDAANNDNGDGAYSAALTKLEALLEQRRKFYETADVVIPLDGRTDEDRERGAPAAVVMHRLMAAVAERIATTRAEREARRNFTIEYTDPAAQQAQQAQ